MRTEDYQSSVKSQRACERRLAVCQSQLCNLEILLKKQEEEKKEEPREEPATSHLK